MDGALQQVFTPEFLGRLDRVVHFEALTDGAMEAIARKYLDQLTKRVSAEGIRLDLPRELALRLAENCRGKGGARQMRRKVQEQVEGPLSVCLLECTGKPSLVRGRLVESRLQFVCE